MPVASLGSIPVSPSPLQGDFHGQAVRQPSDFHGQTVKQQPTASQTKPQVIHSAANDLEQIGLVFNKKLQFVVDHKSNDVIVKVIDKETDKVIKELPPEELQRLHSNLKDTIGFLFDESV